MTKKQMRSEYETRIRQQEFRLRSYRLKALIWTHGHREQREESVLQYLYIKRHLAYLREQLARCQPTKKG